MNKKMIAVMGSDRVGKDTYIESLMAGTTNSITMHYTAPKLTDITPFEMYYRIFPAIEDSTQYVFMNRFLLEAPYYEKIYRDNTVSDSTLVEEFKNFASSVPKDFSLEVRLLKRDWDDEMYLRHLKELLSSRISTGEISQALEERRAVHQAYYLELERVRDLLDFSDTGVRFNELTWNSTSKTWN